METTLEIKTLPAVALHTDAAGLLARVETAMQAADKRCTIPILQYLLIEQDATSYRVTGTNLEFAIQAGTVGDVTARTCYAARELRDALKVAKKHSISLVDGKLTTPLGETTIATLPAEQCPDIPSIETGETVVSFAEFRDALKYIAPCISDEESRFTLKDGALVDVPNGVIVATDGHRLGRRKVAMEGGTRFLICRKIIAALVKSKYAGVCYIGHSDHNTAYLVGDVVYLERKLTGNFPDYERVIPKAFDYTMTFDLASLRAALAAIKPALDVRSKAMRINAVFGAVTLTASTGNSTAHVKAGVNADIVTLVISWQYVMDALATETGETVKLRFSADAKGDVNHATLWGGDTVIMPMRA